MEKITSFQILSNVLFEPSGRKLLMLMSRRWRSSAEPGSGIFGRGELGVTLFICPGLVFFCLARVTWPALWKEPLCYDVKSVTNIYHWGMREHGCVPARRTIKFTAHFGTSHSDHTGLKFLFLMRSCCHILLAFCTIQLWIPYFFPPR